MFKPILKKSCVCLFLLKLFHVFTSGVFAYHHNLEILLDTCVPEEQLSLADWGGHSGQHVGCRRAGAGSPASSLTL